MQRARNCFNARHRSKTHTHASGLSLKFCFASIHPSITASLVFRLLPASVCTSLHGTYNSDGTSNDGGRSSSSSTPTETARLFRPKINTGRDGLWWRSVMVAHYATAYAQALAFSCQDAWDAPRENVSGGHARTHERTNEKTNGRGRVVKPSLPVPDTMRESHATGAETCRLSVSILFLRKQRMPFFLNFAERCETVQLPTGKAISLHSLMYARRSTHTPVDLKCFQVHIHRPNYIRAPSNLSFTRSPPSIGECSSIFSVRGGKMVLTRPEFYYNTAPNCAQTGDAQKKCVCDIIWPIRRKDFRHRGQRESTTNQT